MKKTLKKFLVVVLVLLITVSTTVIMFVTANNTQHNSKKDLLENMLNNRRWVLDVLVEGDYSTNPYLECDDFSSYSESSYGRFKSSSVNSALLSIVDAMYNTGEILSDVLLSKPIEELLELADYYGVVVPDENADDKEYIVTKIANFLSSLEKTREEKYYDYILSGMFTAQYTSDVAMTLEQEENQLTELETLKDNYDGIKNIIDIGKDIVSSGSDTLDNYKHSYIEDILPIYSYSVSTYLNHAGIASSDFTPDMIDDHRAGFTEAMYTMAMCQKYDVDEESIRTWKKTLQTENILNKASKVLKAAGETVNFANEALENYILIESLQNQRESHVSGLTSLSQNTNNNGLRSVTNEYINLINKEYDELTFLYKTGIDTLTNSDLLYDITSDFVKKQATNIILKHANVSTAKVASRAASVLAAAKITTFLADIVTGVEETVKKVYQIEQTLKMIEEMKKAYENDLQTYLSNKTDENAQKVIDDLLLLKRMRLFACKLTYDSASHQLTTPLGKLISDDCDVDSWKQMYREQVDMLLSATINPVSTVPFQLNKGEELRIFPDQNYGILEKNGKFYRIPEISERMMGGLIIDGGKVYIFGDSSKYKSFYISSITTKGESVIVGTGGTNLSVYALENQSGKLSISLDASDLNIYGFMYLNGETEFTEIQDIYVYGDAYWGSNKLSTLKVVGKDKQLIQGYAAVENLIFNNTSNKPIKIGSSVLVTNLISNISSEVPNGKNITLATGGRIVSPYNSDITLEANTFNEPLVINGSIYLKGETVFNSTIDVKGTIHHNSEKSLVFKDNAIVKTYNGVDKTKSVNADKDLTITDIDLNRVNLSVAGTFKLLGDYKSRLGNISVKEFVIAGIQGQSIDGDSIASDKFTINNKSTDAILLNADVNVLEYLNDAKGKIVGTGFAIAGSGCVIENNRYSGNLKLIDYDADMDDFIVGGDLTTIGENHFDVSNFVVGGNLTTNDSVNLISKDFDIAGTFTNNGTINFNLKNINIAKDFVISGSAVIEAEETISLADKLINSGSLTVKSQNFTVNRIQHNGSTLSIQSITPFDIDELLQTKGTLTISSERVDCSVFVQTAGTFVLSDDAEMFILGNLEQRGSFRNNGSVYVQGDVITSVNGGELTVRGDIGFLSNATLNKLIMNGKLRQEISGKNITVDEIHFENNSSDGIRVSNLITCNKTLDVGMTNVQNLNNITVKES